ncbi:MAG: glycosyl hydrolase [Saprospiraceae bacterium]|nr:glycosyl hydrolase [Saprospiraceae bacterium]
MQKAILLIISFLCNLHIVLQGQENPHQKIFEAVQWRELGPPRAGRVSGVCGVNSDLQTYYMATTGGGVWKTSDKGESWNNISDGYFGGSVGAVEISASDPDILYAGTGEETLRGNMSSGNGIWRSTDAGRTWTHMGLAGTKQISRVRIHRKDPNNVLVAAIGNVFRPGPERGIFKSIDGGKNWKKVLYISDTVGASDLAIDPINSQIMYAGMWHVLRNPYQFVSGGSGSGIYKSKDGGESWQNLTQNEGLPEGIWGKVTLSICPQRPERIYAMIENLNGGLYRSDDSGKTWEKVNSENKLRQRSWYFTRVYADPKNPDGVYVLNVSLHYSKDGGKTFSEVNTSHGDHHDLWLDPSNSQRMIVGHDGGAQISENGGKSWSSIYNQPTAQFYRVNVDNHVPFRIYAAQQDNSAIRINSRSVGNKIGFADWESTAGGESGYIVPDPIDPELVIGGSYGGYLTLYDHNRDISQAINVWPDNPIGHGAEDLKYRFQWNFPIFYSAHDSTKLYVASNHLHVSKDRGQSWSTISPDLTKNDKSRQKASGGPVTKDNTSVEYYCTIFCAAESPAVEGLLWTGSDDGLVFVSKDAGKNWTNVSPPLLPDWTLINSIEPDPKDPSVCYLAATSYKNGDDRPYLFRTNDFGKTWMLITKGIAQDHFTRCIRVDALDPSVLYAGTEKGIYISYNKGELWYPLQQNLPITPITDLVIKNNSLIASTQGRGLWIIDNLEPIRKANKSIQKPQLFTPNPSLRDYGSSQEKPTPHGKNLPSEIMLYSYFPNWSKKDTALIFLISDSNDTVSISSNFPTASQNKVEIKAGSNLILIPYTGSPATSFDNMVLWWSSLKGPSAYPGQYKIILKSNAFTDSLYCRIDKDPRFPVTDEDVKKNYDFIKSLRNKIDEAHKCILEMRDIKNQMNNFFSGLPDSDSLKELKLIKSEIDSIFTQVEQNLYQTKNKSNQDPINYPIKLTNKLGHLIALYGESSFPPPQQAIEFSDETFVKVDQEINRYKITASTQLQTLNEKIRILQLDAIRPKKIENKKG